MKNPSRFLNTGPPRLKNVDAAAANRGTKSRRKPNSARDNLQFGFLRQVAKRPLGLAHVEKALWPEPLALVADNGRTKEGGANTTFSAAVALRANCTGKGARP